MNDAGSTAGLTHEWNVQTQYYKTTVPIWVDEIADPEGWKSEFLKPEAKEVVEAIGAWVYCFRPCPTDEPVKETSDVMQAIQQILEQHAGHGADSVMLAVRAPSEQASSGKSAAEDWEGACLEHGFEYVDYTAKGTNEFGEKTGFERLREALEANEWAATIHSDSEPELDDLDYEDAFTRRDEAEMTAELFGMKAALAGADDFEAEAEDFLPPTAQETEVEDLDRLMGKLLAVKEQSADLPEAQRRRMAARAVKEVMDGGEGKG